MAYKSIDSQLWGISILPFLTEIHIAKVIKCMLLKLIKKKKFNSKDFLLICCTDSNRNTSIAPVSLKIQAWVQQTKPFGVMINGQARVVSVAWDI